MNNDISSDRYGSIPEGEDIETTHRLNLFETDKIELPILCNTSLSIQ